MQRTRPATHVSYRSSQSSFAATIRLSHISTSASGPSSRRSGSAPSRDGTTTDRAERAPCMSSIASGRRAGVFGRPPRFRYRRS